MTTHIMLDLETWGKRPGCDIRSIGACVFDPVTGDVSIPCKTCKGGTTRGNINEGGDCSDCMNTRMERGFGDTFYIATDNRPTAHFSTGEPAIWEYELRRDPETVKWWNDQSAEAQAAFANPVDLRDACLQFMEWLDDQCSGRAEDIRLWCNGPSFDAVILAAVYDAVGLPVPWHYRAPRDMRTITDAAGMQREEFCNYGEAHHALHDAIAQAMTVCEAYKRLGLQHG